MKDEIFSPVLPIISFNTEEGLESHYCPAPNPLAFVYLLRLTKKKSNEMAGCYYCHRGATG
jgi:hypothetical protein